MMKRLKIATDCSGIGSPEQALKELGIKHEIVFACDIDKYARQTYTANFKPKYMFDDMTLRDNSQKQIYADLYMAGIPCQSFSLAGKRLGEADPRGLLFYNFYDYVKQHRPKYFMIENVKGLLSDNGGATFQTWLDLLSNSVNTLYNMFNHEDSLEYNVHWTVLNSKDFGVPQNRERVYIVGIRNDLPNTFRFPVGWTLPIRLKHVLEPVVDEKYYLSEKMLNYLFSRKDNFNNGQINFKTENDIASCINASSKSLDISDNIIVEANPRSRIISADDQFSPAILANQSKQSTDSIYLKESKPELIKVGTLYPDDNDAGRIYSPEGISSTIKSEGGGLGAKTGLYVVAQRGRYNETGVQTEQQLEFRDDGLTNTLTSVQKDNMIFDGCRIRRLTPLECFRLQGFPDEYIKPVSDSQLYKQAGNTITTNVLKEIFKNLLT